MYTYDVYRMYNVCVSMNVHSVHMHICIHVHCHSMHIRYTYACIGINVCISMNVHSIHVMCTYDVHFIHMMCTYDVHSMAVHMYTYMYTFTSGYRVAKTHIRCRQLFAKKPLIKS